MMDNLHSVIRSIKGETKSPRRDHLSVFREFISQLDRIGRKPAQTAKKGGRRSARGK
jgi:hypothetical protein